MAAAAILKNQLSAKTLSLLYTFASNLTYGLKMTYRKPQNKRLSEFFAISSCDTHFAEMCYFVLLQLCE